MDGISNYQISLLTLHCTANTITYITNTPFPSLPLLPSPFLNTKQYSSSNTKHQYNNPK